LSTLQSEKVIEKDKTQDRLFDETETQAFTLLPANYSL